MNDCISRVDALDILGDSNSWEEAFHKMKALPSVTPTERTGHWIKVTNGRGGHECDICHEYAPSYQDGDEYLTKYCTNCGARMVGNNNDR